MGVTTLRQKPAVSPAFQFCQHMWNHVESGRHGHARRSLGAGGSSFGAATFRTRSKVTMQAEKISLYYKDGGSDKVYLARLIASPDPSLWIVEFQYGRRGQSLQSGTKTSSPVPFEKAKKIYDKLVAEKKGKGYTEGEDGTPYEGTDKAGEVSGLVPQLLNIIDIDEVQLRLKDDNWIMQEKMDGVRLMVRFDGSMIEASNKKGLLVAIPGSVTLSVRNLLTDFSSGILDGELIGDQYFVFDMLSLNGQNLRNLPFLMRYVQLVDNVVLGSELPHPNVQCVPIATDFVTKNKLFNTIKARRGEGVVFKHLDSYYVPGRPNSGGNQLKYKFKSSATCVVTKRNEGKRSVAIHVFMPSKGPTYGVSVGNVTIPANFSVPEAGELIEVEYLYAFPGGSLFQPVYKGRRLDQDRPDEYCSLKFKAGTEEDDEA